jgi:hypothetical protein
MDGKELASLNVYDISFAATKNGINRDCSVDLIADNRYISFEE